MNKKKKARKLNNLQKSQKPFEESQSEKSNNLIIGGVLLAMSSIGLLIFVISEKIFHLS